MVTCARTLLKMTTTNQNAGLVEANKGGINIPPFCTEKPGTWFVTTGASFKIAGIISDGTKFKISDCTVGTKIHGKYLGYNNE